MDSEQKYMLAAVILYVSFLFVGLPYLGKVVEPFTLQAATFRGQEVTAIVHTNRQAVTVTDDISAIEVFTQKGKIMTRQYVMAPRAGGVFITARKASADEYKLLRDFF